jgi:phospholipase C
VPGATWPNRNFAHAGTSDESVDIEVGFYQDRTIFQLLDNADPPAGGPKPDRNWRIYYDKMPQVIAFDWLWSESRPKNWLPLHQVAQDIRDYRDDNVTLAKYSFIEPCHQGDGSNSQHPGNNERYGSYDFARGEALIAEIYDALVGNSVAFNRTVFVITYDEHGGLYDRRPPPKAVPPDPLRGRSRSILRNLVGWFVEYPSQPFAFNFLGVRVPTVIVSPWVEPGRVSQRVYDHASIPATVHRLFASGQPRLTVREEWANDFLHLIIGRTETNNPTPTDAGMVTAEALRESGTTDAPRRAAVEAARTDDLFEQQLAALESAAHRRLVTVVAPGATREAGSDELARIPAMHLFAALADSIRRGEQPPTL